MLQRVNNEVVLRLQIIRRVLFIRELFLLFVHLSFSSNSMGGIADYPLRFRNLGLQSGLSNVSVQSILQDSLGLIWIGTARGLNHYDGSTITSCFFDDHDPATLYHDQILDMLMTPDQKIFIGSMGGVNCMDVKKEQMRRIGCSEQSYNSLVTVNGQVYAGSYGFLEQFDTHLNRMIRVPQFPEHFLISSMLVREEKIWCLNDQSLSFLIFDPVTTRYVQHQVPQNEGPGKFRFTCGSFYNQWLLLGTNSGLLVFDTEGNEFVKIDQQFPLLKSIDCLITDIVSHDNKLWVGTLSQGLYVYDVPKNQIQQYRKQEEDGLSSDYITEIFFDSQDNLWVGTFDAGLNVAFNQRRLFNYDPALNHLFKGRFVTAILPGEDGLLYIGTRHHGLFVYDQAGQTVQNFHSGNSILKTNLIQTLMLDQQGKLWMGGDPDVYLFDPQTTAITRVALPQPNEGIVDFFEVNDSLILGGSPRNGLFHFDARGNILKTDRRMGHNITKMSLIEPGRLAVTSYGYGLYEYWYQKDSFVYLSGKMAIDPGKTKQAITCFVDSQGSVWTGNLSYGLMNYNLKTGDLKRFSIRDGLPSNDVVAIMEDHNQRLWLSTSYGLSCLEPGVGFVNYYLSEGTGNQQYHQKAVAVDDHGVIYFGGNTGLTYFNADSVKLNSRRPPKIVLRSLNVFNEKVFPGPQQLLDQHLAYTRSVELDHRSSVFSIDFIGIDFMSGDRLQYAYQLEGFDKEWVHIGSRTRASFSNLKPGIYHFKVKVVNNYGFWSEETQPLTIKIKPAPWKSRWALMSYFLVLLFLVYIAFRILLNNRLYKRELLMEQREKEHEKTIHNMKYRFFENISHELRTPLTLINAIVEKMVAEGNEKVQEPLRNLKYSTDKLLGLVNQLLLFKNLESDTLQLSLAETDLVQLTGRYLKPFYYLAEAKSIAVDFSSDQSSIILPLDRDIYEKVFNNLVGNALKYNREGGSVRVQLTTLSQEAFQSAYGINGETISKMTPGFAQLLVEDTGIGIPPALLSTLFDRYTRGEKAMTWKTSLTGVGIGLSFTKRLIELHKGFIKVESEVGVGTRLSVALPLGPEAYDPKDYGVRENCPDVVVTPEHQPSTGPQEPLLKQTDVTIALIEDDLALTSYLKGFLQQYYRVIHAFNGVDGLKLIHSHLPDLVVSDIMMPMMDGYTLCREIKGDELLSHIPVILLTAKTETNDQIAGYKVGADAYVNKPFSSHLLLSQINSIIQTRRNLQKSYQFGMMPALDKEEICHQELNFLKKLDAVIGEHFDQFDFNIQRIAEEMNMSRATFYRKFLSLTKVSPNDYLRKYRINKSIEFYKQGVTSISDLSFRCGFNYPSSFTAAFKKEKGVSPTSFFESKSGAPEL